MGLSKPLSSLLSRPLSRPLEGDGAVAPWTPADITTYGWYDAADAATITEVGGKVSQWDDKSGNAVDLTQGVGADQPTTGVATIGGLNAIEFPFGDHLDNLPGLVTGPSDDMAIFVVLQEDVATANESSPFRIDGTQTRCWARFSYNSFRIEDNIEGVISSNANLTEDGNPHVTSYFFGTYTGWRTRNYEDSVLRSESAPHPTPFTQVFTGDQVRVPYRNWLGKIGEIVITQISSDADRHKVEGYLAWKWGLVDKLPLAHPYRWDGTEFGFGAYWTPAAIDTESWFDPADTSTITEVLGAVSQWDDKSGNSRHISQASGAKQPTYTTIGGIIGEPAPCLLFDGTDDRLIGSSFGELGDDLLTVAFTAPLTQTANANCQYGIIDYFRFRSSTDHRGGLRATAGASGDAFSNFEASALDRTGNGLWGTVTDGTADEIRLLHNAEQIASQAITSQAAHDAKVAIGARPDADVNPWLGFFFELVVCTDTSDATREKIEGYLAHKWGQTDKLPVSHPYKSTPPTI